MYQRHQHHRAEGLIQRHRIVQHIPCVIEIGQRQGGRDVFDTAVVDIRQPHKGGGDLLEQRVQNDKAKSDQKEQTQHPDQQGPAFLPNGIP